MLIEQAIPRWSVDDVDSPVRPCSNMPKVHGLFGRPFSDQLQSKTQKMTRKLNWRAKASLEIDRVHYQFSSIDANMDSLFAMFFQCTCFSYGSLCQTALQFPRQALTTMECMNRLILIVVVTLSCLDSNKKSIVTMTEMFNLKESNTIQFSNSSQST